MAIVFISPKRKQKVFLGVIVASSVVFMALILAVVFLPDFLRQNAPPSVPMEMPALSIDSTVLDSDAVKNLEPIAALPIAFDYVVQDKEKKQLQGQMFAANKEDAKTILEGKQYTVISLQESGLGRSNPFSSY